MSMLTSIVFQLPGEQHNIRRKKISQPQKFSWKYQKKVSVPRLAYLLARYRTWYLELFVSDQNRWISISVCIYGLSYSDFIWEQSSIQILSCHAIPLWKFSFGSPISECFPFKHQLQPQTSLWSCKKVKQKRNDKRKQKSPSEQAFKYHVH